MTHTCNRLITLTLVAVVLAACSSAESRKSGYLKRGNDYLAAGNYEKARLEYRNALQLEPTNATTMFLAGEANEKLGNLREAAELYQSALNSTAPPVEARVHLARLYILTGAPESAMKLIEPGIAQNPNHAGLLTMRGAARQQLGDKIGARADAERAVKLAPADENAVSLLAAIYTRAGEVQQATDLVSRAAQAPKASKDMLLELAQIDLAAGRRADAVVQLRKVVAIEPKVLAHRYRLAQVLLIDQDLDGAEAALRAAIAQAPENAEPKLALVDFLAARRSPEKATAALRAMSAAAPHDLPLRLGAAQFYAARGQTSVAVSIYREITKTDGDGPAGQAARNSLARTFLLAGQLDNAEPLINQALEKNPRDDDALAARAELSLARGKAAAAIADLRAVLRDEPNAVAVQRALVRAYLKDDDLTLAEETLRAALQNSPTDPGLRLDLAQLLTRTGRANQGLPMLEKLAADEPGNTDVLQALFASQLARKDLAGAQRTAELVQAARPGSEKSAYLQGLAQSAVGNTAAAREAFERALSINPDALEPVTALIQLYLSQKKPEAALERIDSAVARFPDNAALHSLRGDVLMVLGRTEAARVSYGAAISHAPNWAAPYRNLAALELTAKNDDAAIRTLNAGIRKAGGAAPLVADLAGIYERQGKIDQAADLYEALLQRSPESKIAANNLAMLLALHRTDNVGLNRARALAAPLASSGNANMIDTWGWVLYKRREYAAALTALRSAADGAPDAPVVLYHLGMAQLANGARDAARATLHRALRTGAVFEGDADAQESLRQLDK